MKSMWYYIRKEAGLKQKHIAKKFNVSAQFVSKIERGEYPMPIKFQIYYLSLRNNDTDKIIIEYLQELENKRKERY